MGRKLTHEEVRDPMANRFRWELVETGKDGTKICAHGRPIAWDEEAQATLHLDDHTRCLGTE